MRASRLTSLTKVNIAADGALVADTKDRGDLAAITKNSLMHNVLLSFMSSPDFGCNELVDLLFEEALDEALDFFGHVIFLSLGDQKFSHDVVHIFRNRLVHIFTSVDLKPGGLSLALLFLLLYDNQLFVFTSCLCIRLSLLSRSLTRVFENFPLPLLLFKLLEVELSSNLRVTKHGVSSNLRSCCQKI